MVRKWNIKLTTIVSFTELLIGSRKIHWYKLNVPLGCKSLGEPQVDPGPVNEGVKPWGWGNIFQYHFGVKFVI